MRFQHPVLADLAIARQGAGGAITIATRNMIQSSDQPEGPTNLEPGEYVVVRIGDDGPGIDAAIADKVFDPFFTTKEIGQGLGLGLAISSSIVREFGGQLSAADRPGGGAEFVVMLRRAPAPEGAAPRDAATSISPTHTE